MTGPTLYVLAILGCGETDDACLQVSVAETRYESLEACMADTAGAVVRSADLPYPVVVAQCRRADQRLSDIMPGDVELPDADAPPPPTRPADGAARPVVR
jgi:hypothetical protein